MPLVVQVKFDELHIFIHNVDAALKQQIDALTTEVKAQTSKLQNAIPKSEQPTGE